MGTATQENILEKTDCSVKETQKLVLKLATDTRYSQITTKSQAQAYVSLCQKSEKLFLSKHPLVLSLLARAHFCLGNLREALNLCRVTQTQFRLHDVMRLREEILFEAEVLRALSHLDEALQRVIVLRGENPDGEVGITAAKNSEPELEYQLRLGLLYARIKHAQGEISVALNELIRIQNFCTHEHQLIKLKILKHEYRLELGQDCSRVPQYLRMIAHAKVDELSVSRKTAISLNYARQRLAFLLVFSGQVLRAQDLKSAFGDSTDNLARHFLEALIALSRRDYEEAHYRISEAQKNNNSKTSLSERSGVYWYKALCLFAQGKLGCALTAMSKIQDLCESSPYSARNNLLEALIRCECNDHRSARKLVDRALTFEDSESNLAQIMFYLVSCELKDSEPEVPEQVSQESYLALALLCAANPRYIAYIYLSDFYEDLSAEFFSILDYERVIQRFEEVTALVGGKESNKIMLRLGVRVSLGEKKELDPITFSVQLFGSMKLTLGGHEVDVRSWRKSKTRELFLAIMTNAGKDISRDYLIEQIWPGAKASACMNNYYVTWSNLRKMLCGGDLSLKHLIPIRNAGNTFFVDLSKCKVDVLEFENAVREGRSFLSEGSIYQAFDCFRKANEIYKGDLLPGDAYYDWLIPRREHYRALLLTANLSAAMKAFKEELDEDALYFAERGLRIHPGKEKLAEIAMEVLIKQGFREEAIRIYHQARVFLSEELGLDPSKKLGKLYAQAIMVE